MPDRDGNLTDEELERIRTWPSDDLLGWLAYIKTIWQAADWGWSEGIQYYYVSTGGWSGNEDIISAMQENRWPWSLTWQSTRRGGHYVFEVPRA